MEERGNPHSTFKSRVKPAVVGTLAALALYAGGIEVDKNKHAKHLDKHINQPAQQILNCYGDNPNYVDEDGDYVPDYEGLTDLLVEGREAHNKQNNSITTNSLQLSKGQYVIETEVARPNPLNWTDSIKTDSLEAYSQKANNLSMELNGFTPVENSQGNHKKNSNGSYIYRLRDDILQQDTVDFGAVEQSAMCSSLYGSNNTQLVNEQGNPYEADSYSQVSPEDIYLLEQRE